MNLMQNPLFDAIAGWHKAELFYTGTNLGIFEALAAGPLNLKELAAGKLAEEKLFRLLRALVSFDYLSYESTTSTFSLTKQSQDAAGPASACLLYMLAPSSKRAWGELTAGIRNDAYPFVIAHGERLWEYLQKHPEESIPFNNFMNVISVDGSQFAKLLEPVFDFKPYKKIVDVGGGEGGLLWQILQLAPDAHGVVYDQQHVVEGGIAKLDTVYKAIKDRIEFVGGDFLTYVPSGGDVYVMKLILHDWDDEYSTKILKCIHKEIPANGKLLVIDSVVQMGDAFSTTMDMHMMALLDGKERSAEQFATLFDGAGFKLTKITPLPTKLALVEAVKK